MAYHSKYSGAEVDALLDKIKDDEVGSIDSSLSTTSDNPVKNKVITEELNKKANKTDIATINGQPLTNGGNIEVITDAYDDTEIKGKLTELDSQIEGEATARTNADAELQTQINGKQEALTLTVKDNGNIVLANIQGQSKEFMPATPSGDPMHWAYVAAGTEYNDTGSDIVKDAPWADLADDDADKIVVHKAGYWYCNGLGDLTTDEMRLIYMNRISNIGPQYLFEIKRGYIHRTIINQCESQQSAHDEQLSYYSTNCQTINVGRTNFTHVRNYSRWLGHSQVSSIIGVVDERNQTTINDSRESYYCSKLKHIHIKSMKFSHSFSMCANLTIKSILYMINNEAATSPITITLHADVYNKCMANADILTSLETHTNISLASA